jgi:hypothetical protein
MKKLFKRGLLGAVAVAVPVTAALALPMAAHAAASNQTATDSTVYSGVVKGNVDIPAGVSIFVGSGTEFTGNVTVEGDLKAAGVIFDKNLIVNGGSLTVINQGITVDHDLSIFNSPGAPDSGGNGFYNDAGQSTIKGTFLYVDNTGYLGVYLDGSNPNSTPTAGAPYGTTAHNFVYADNANATPSDPGLTVTGFQITS